jgi:hypothetical protein
VVPEPWFLSPELWLLDISHRVTAITRFQGPGFRDQVSGTRFQGPGFRFQDSEKGTRFQGPGFRDQVSDFRIQKNRCLVIKGAMSIFRRAYLGICITRRRTSRIIRKPQAEPFLTNSEARAGLYKKSPVSSLVPQSASNSSLELESKFERPIGPCPRERRED